MRQVHPIQCQLPRELGRFNVFCVAAMEPVTAAAHSPAGLAGISKHQVLELSLGAILGSIPWEPSDYFLISRAILGRYLGSWRLDASDEARNWDENHGLFLAHLKSCAAEPLVVAKDDKGQVGSKATGVTNFQHINLPANCNHCSGIVQPIKMPRTWDKRL